MGGFDTPKKVMISQVEIDADKVWEDTLGTPHGISRLKEVVLNMLKGDLAVRGTDVLESIVAGSIGYVLTSAGPLHKPVWGPAPGPLQMYLPAVMEAVAAVAMTTPDRTIAESAAFVSAHYQAYVDAPADYLRRFDLSFSAADAASMKTAADQSIAEAIVSPSGLSILCDGFIEETGAAVQTDKTAEARSAAANDLNLNPMTPVINDKVYIGSNYPFWQAQVLLGTPGVGNWLNSWYYWNGVWLPVVGEIDGSNEWQYGATMCHITHTPQGDWVPCVQQGMNLYWIRSNTDAYTNQVTAPLGTQVWVAIA